MNGGGRGGKVHRERISRNASDPGERRRRRRGWVFARFARKRRRLRPTAVTTSSGESSRWWYETGNGVTQHASLGSIACMYACFRRATYDCRTELELEYLFGIDCTPVSLWFFQEFEPYDPWHWSLSCSESSSRAAARLWRPLPRNGKGRRANEEASANGAREFLLDDKPFSFHKGTVKANKNRSICLAAITLDVVMKIQRIVGKFDIVGASAPHVANTGFAILLRIASQ